MDLSAMWAKAQGERELPLGVAHLIATLRAMRGPHLGDGHRSFNAYDAKLYTAPPAAAAEARDADWWSDAVHTLIGHAEGLRAEGKSEMPAWLYKLAESIAGAHLDAATAARIRELAAHQKGGGE